MWRWGAITVTLLGCGRIYFDPRADGAPMDVACVLGPWQGPTEVSELSTADDESSPAIRHDHLEIVFSRSSLTAAGDLFLARRSSPSDSFGAPMPLTALNTIEKDNAPEFSPDGLTLYWMSDITGIRIWMATRASLDDMFANPVVLPGGPFDEQVDPSLTGDHLQLFQSSSFGNLAVSTRTSPTEMFGVPVLIPAPIESTNWQEGPAISDDGLTLYYIEIIASMFQMLVATRADPASPFGPPALFPPLANTGPVHAPDLSRDGRALYFVYRTAGSTSIWKLTRDCVP